MAYITKKKLVEILNNAPSGVDKTKIAQELINRGNILEGYNEKQTGFLTNVARDIISPFAKTIEGVKSAGSAFGSVVKAAYQLKTGDKAGSEETMRKAGEKIEQRADTIPILGQGVPTVKTQKQAIGVGLEVGSNFIGAEGGSSIIKNLVKAPLKSLAVRGATTGFKSGILYGAGKALQEDKNVLGGAFGGGVVGAAGGAVLSPLLSGAGIILKNAVPYLKNRTLTAAENKLVNVSNELIKMTPTTIKKENAWGKNTAKFLVEEKIIPLVSSQNGKIKADDAITALRAKSQLENTALKNILKDSGKKISIDEYANRLKQEIPEDLKNRGTDLENAISKIDKEVEAYKKNYADKITNIDGQSYIDVADFNDIKSGLWQKSSVSRRVPGSELDADIFYQMGHSAKDIIEETIDDANINSLNSRLGDFAQAIKVLETANGKVLPGGFIGKGFTKLAGTIAGAAGGGMPGSIIGNITGGVLADIASNPKVRTSILAKIYNKLEKQGKTDIIEEAQKILEKRGAERAKLKLLEAPKWMPLKSKTDTSKLFTQEEANELLNSLKPKEKQKLLNSAGKNPIPLPQNTQTSINKIMDKQVLPKKKIEDVSKTPLKSKEFKSAIDALRDPTFRKKQQYAISQLNKGRVTKTSNNLYHSTPSENLDSIISGGLKTGQKPRFEGVSSPKKISFSANEDAAKYYGGDVMLRTKTSYKPNDLEYDLLAGGEGTYLTGKNIPPEMLEIKVGNKWIPLKDYKSTPLKSTPLLSKDIQTFINKVYKEAPLAKDEIDAVAKELAKKYGGMTALAPLKKQEKVLFNIKNKYNGDTSKVSDIARNTIIVDSKNINKVFEELQKNPNYFSGKFVDPTKDPLGYMGFNTKYKASNGHIAEIQINTPDMIYAKESAESAISQLGQELYNKLNTQYNGIGGKGHKFYDEWALALERGDINLAEQIAKESTNYYKQFIK